MTAETQACEEMREKLTMPSQALLHRHYDEAAGAIRYTEAFSQEYGTCVRAIEAHRLDGHTLQGVAAAETSARLRGRGQAAEGWLPLEGVRHIAQYEDGVPLLAMIAPRTQPLG